MKKLIVLSLLAATLAIGSGCAITRTKQLAEIPNGERRKTTTTTISIWDALAKLGGFKASQGDKTQTMSISESSAQSTSSNLVTIAGSGVELGKLLAPK